MLGVTEDNSELASSGPNPDRGCTVEYPFDVNVLGVTEDNSDLASSGPNPDRGWTLEYPEC